MKKILYIDMDNVLVDFTSAVPHVPQPVLDEYDGHWDDIPGIFSLMQASDKCCGAEMAGGRVGCCGARMAGGRVGCCGAGIAGGRVGCCGTGMAGGRVRCMAACGLLVHGGGGTRGAWWWVDFEFTNAPLESSRLPLGVGVGVGMSEY